MRGADEIRNTHHSCLDEVCHGLDGHIPQYLLDRFVNLWAHLNHLLSDDGLLNVHFHQNSAQRVEKCGDTRRQRQVNAPCLSRDGQASIGDDQGIRVA